MAGATKRDGGRFEEHSARELLEERFARGEIDDERFREQRKTLIGC